MIIRGIGRYTSTEYKQFLHVLQDANTHNNKDTKVSYFPSLLWQNVCKTRFFILVIY